MRALGLGFFLGSAAGRLCYPEIDTSTRGPVAQLVEHRTFNAVVAGSNPARLTI